MQTQFFAQYHGQDGATYDDIERKTGLAQEIARKTARLAIELTGCEDIDKALA